MALDINCPSCADIQASREEPGSSSNPGTYSSPFCGMRDADVFAIAILCPPEFMCLAKCLWKSLTKATTSLPLGVKLCPGQPRTSSDHVEHKLPGLKHKLPDVQVAHTWQESCSKARGKRNAGPMDMLLAWACPSWRRAVCSWTAFFFFTCQVNILHSHKCSRHVAR